MEPIIIISLPGLSKHEKEDLYNSDRIKKLEKYCTVLILNSNYKKPIFKVLEIDYLEQSELLIEEINRLKEFTGLY